MRYELGLEPGLLGVVDEVEFELEGLVEERLALLVGDDVGLYLVDV
jgi:hypothetical protein